MLEHKCKIDDLVWGEEPDIDSGECVSFPVTCKVCGKKYEEVYTKNAGLFDPETEEYVYL